MLVILNPNSADGSPDNTTYLVFSLTIPIFTEPIIYRVPNTFRIKLAPYTPISPKPEENVLFDSPFNIQWELGAQVVNIYLLKNNTIVSTIQSGVSSTVATFGTFLFVDHCIASSFTCSPLPFPK
jgi:hypothetical protein